MDRPGRATLSGFLPEFSIFVVFIIKMAPNRVKIDNLCLSALIFMFYRRSSGGYFVVFLEKGAIL